MSVREQAGAADAAAVGPEHKDLPAQHADPSRLLARLSVLPALLVMAWLLPGLLLLLAGQFRFALMLGLSIPLAVIALFLGLRWTPEAAGTVLAPAAPARARAPWWAVAGVLAVALAFGADQLIYHSQFIIVIRDPASYVQFGNWIARHGSLPIPDDAAAFGGNHPGLTFSSFAFYQEGGVIIPQFMAGLPMVLAAAFWVHGVTAAVAMAPLLGACGVLAFGGLVARLVGPRWAPLGALLLALALPEQFTSRSDYSEPLTQLLLLGGLCLVIDALNTSGKRSRVLAALGGLALGLTLLVRIDGASDMLPLVPYIGLLFVQRKPQALPMLCGLLAGAVYGAVDGAVLSWPYLDSISSSLYPLLIVVAVVVVLTIGLVLILRRRGLPRTSAAWLVNAASAVAVVVAVGFTIRPYIQTVRAAKNASSVAAVAGYQRADHLPIDGTRLYYEMSMTWVFWYIGVPAVILATLGAALLSRRCLRGQAPTWVLPLVTFAWTIVTTLYQPSITPDQPWASRRLVPAVLPGFIVLAVWGLSWLLGRLRQTRLNRVAWGVVAVVCVAALLLPAIHTTYGLVKRYGPARVQVAGLRLYGSSVAFTRTYAGEIATVNKICSGLPANATVLFVDGPTSDRFQQVVRGMCGVPAGVVYYPTKAKVAAVVRGIEAAHRQPVLMAGTLEEASKYGPSPRRLAYLNTPMDESSLVTPPAGLWTFNWSIWISEPSP